MNVFEFLKYWLDTHPIIFGMVALTLAGGIYNILSNLFYNKHKSDADKEHERRFWK